LRNKKICLTFILVFLIGYSQVCVVGSDVIQDKSLAFIEDVIPIDSYKWKINLLVDSNPTDLLAREYLDKNNISVAEKDRVLVYSLGSRVGTADLIYVIFTIRDGAFFQGVINIDNSPSYLQTYSQFVTPFNKVAASDFLVAYQQWSGHDSTKMIEQLSSVDITQNAKVTSPDLAMTINHNDVYTAVRWVFEDSKEFSISFNKYFPVRFYDTRQISSNASTPTSPDNSIAPTSTDSSPVSTPVISDWRLTVAIAAIIVAVVIPLLVIAIKKRRN
jgi:hypothetical protein